MATGIVFHYTSSGALPSIVTSGTETIIRATGIEYLNDQSELHTGLELVSSILTQEPHILELDELAIDALRNTFFEDTLETFSDRYYVACFSCATGLVDQWRGYGENGIGFALGFTRSQIEDNFSQYPNVETVECLYEPEEQRNAIIESVKRVDEFFSRLERSAIDGYDRSIDPGMFHFALKDALQKQLLRIKHTAYHQEREWRIIIAPLSGGPNNDKNLILKPKFRSSPRGLIPYVSLSLPRLRALIVGPSDYQEQNIKAARLLLRHIGYSRLADDMVKGESIPFRG